MQNNVFHVAAKALIFNNNKQILVLRKNPKRARTNNPDHWDLPGGRLKGNQTLKEALLMEIEEELKIEPSQIKIIKLFDASLSKLKICEKNGPFSLVLFTYLCKLNPENINLVLNEEHSEYLWTDIEKAKELLSTKFSNEFINKLTSLC